MKRLWVSVITGFVLGLFCAWAASSKGFGTWVLVSIVANRTTIGLAIGISKFSKMHWALHGMLFGALFGLPLSLSVLQSGVAPFVVLEIASIIYGFIIEVVVRIFFRIEE